MGDNLVWDNGQWKAVSPGPASIGKPLLQVKKIDDRLMNLELWDAEGKNKISLTLLKSTENWAPQKIEQEFKFIAARTRSQYIFEIQKERMLLKPQDCIVMTDGGWKVLSSEQEIDDYVNRRIRGTLFVFDGISKKDDRQVLMGTLFNPSRSDMQPIELVIPQANVNVITVPSNQPQMQQPSQPQPQPMYAPSTNPMPNYSPPWPPQAPNTP